MPKRIRVALVAVVAVTALAVAGTAMAAFTPHIVVSHQSYATGSNAQTTISLTANQTDNSIAKITIYAPAAYSATLSQAAGTTLGTVLARAYSNVLQGVITIKGNVVVADQTAASLRTASIRCTGTAAHATVWMLALSAAGTPLNIPVFIDPAAGAEATFASTKMQICLTSPDIPESAGGAPFGAKVLEATMALNGVFTNPSSPAQYVWRALDTPYQPGTGTPNVAGTVETRGIVPVPTTVSLTGKYNRRTKRYRLLGAVRQATDTATMAGLPNVRVALYRGATKSKLKAAGGARTNAKGAFSSTGRLRRTTYFQARVVRAVQDVTTGGCATQSLAPAGCVSASLAPLDVRSRVVAVRRR
jgi:hypothetical protein